MSAPARATVAAVPGERLPARPPLDPIEVARSRAALQRALFGEVDAVTRVDRFTILSTRGRGAMAKVYEAWDPVLDRKVAVKLLDAAPGPDEATRDRHTRAVIDEARAMARVAHPNVVPVHEVGVHGEEVFIAMEYVEGGTLRQWLLQPREREAILAVFEQAGRGLAAAHAAGLVHRDFKPDNVLVGEDLRVRVADFGLARVDATAPAGAGARSARSGSRTQTSETGETGETGDRSSGRGDARGRPRTPRGLRWG